MGTEKDAFKAAFEVAVEKSVTTAVTILRGIRDSIAKPKVKAQLDKALAELLTLTPDENIAERAIAKAEAHRYVGDELPRLKGRLERVKSSKRRKAAKPKAAKVKKKRTIVTNTTRRRSKTGRATSKKGATTTRHSASGGAGASAKVLSKRR